MARNYKVSGKKLQPKDPCFSKNVVRDLVRQGIMVSVVEAKAEYISGFGRNAWNKVYRQPARLAKKRMIADYYEDMSEVCPS